MVVFRFYLNKSDYNFSYQLEEEQIDFVLKMGRTLVKEYVEIINNIGDKELEKELKNDLLDYKITLDIEADSLIADSDLVDIEMPDAISHL